MINIDSLNFDSHGFIIGVVQSTGGEIRTVGVLNREAIEKTLETGLVTFWNRSKKKLWTKGETSGNSLRLVDIRCDCDQDTLLIVAEPEGPTCHTGAISCFGGDPLPVPWLEHLENLLMSRKATADVEGSYTQKLFARGVDRIGKKVVEEAGEVVIAAKNYGVNPSEKNKEEYLGEAADLLFHLQVLLIEQGFGLKDIAKVLQERHRKRT